MTARIVVAGTSSGAGKTSVACGLIAALRARGMVVQGFKVGPDYIDPSYHALASGRPGRNLDAFLAGPELVAPLALHGAGGADVAVIEGVMGLFDGASGRGELASTAHVAKLLQAPVLLVIDAASMARSAAAIVHGYRTFDPDVEIAGVIVNKVGSDHHVQLLREAIEPLGVPVVGALRRDDRVAAPERHLGLVPADERTARTRAAIDALGEAVLAHVDLDRVLALARTAPRLGGQAWSPAVDEPAGASAAATIAIARGSAFSFHYEENLELLRAAGATLAPFDPTRDTALPDGAGALILAGGFPEVFGAELSANAELRERVAAFARSGRPVLAECGGLLYLCDALDDVPMCGVLPARGRMAGRLSIGYREAAVLADSALWRAGEQVRGHEFHYSAVDQVGGRATNGVSDLGEGAAAWELTARGRTRAEGFVAGGVHASYLHVHWAAFPQAARRLVAAAAREPTWA
ncbi:MAG: cobyrinate a,c-diamide synthase [Solirubrobacteraceae bacterium]|nr:cobyrinate a,c-diamide synthase [Solirubrobacteraceae bacterium]